MSDAVYAAEENEKQLAIETREDPQDVEGDIPTLQEAAYQNSRSKGFHEHGDQLRNKIGTLLVQRANFPAVADAIRVDAELKFFERLLTDYTGNRLMLIAGEVTEAHEELRAGHEPSEIYYKDGKPEGVPIELADAVIRIFDFAEEFDFDLATAIAIKMAFNSDRPAMHGGKSF